MEIRFGHLCDYATLGAGGKLILVGIFDQVTTTGLDAPIGVPMSYLVFKLECSIADGSDHAVRVRLKDADEQTVQDSDEKDLDWDVGTRRFQPAGPGRPLSQMVLVTVQGLTVPVHGDYAFEVRVDGAVVGEVPFYVVAPPTTTD